MAQSLLVQSLGNVYIPPSTKQKHQEVPPYHPCLIVQDSQTDLTKIKPCGCADAYCVKNAPLWIPQAKR
ncbi:hypothetical protein METSCH_F00130 [Metschnikowia aff. pulcherrima]|uniref:Uncharacterized protein n=1 Tax=Metschnikowia aff. pulcherrima TaxID=2163413 RepID=A0A4P6XSA0_9ASCO|nr:hypothetical protein METSCH_F00130 [Metschnikowia aff. pulcherrima]